MFTLIPLTLSLFLAAPQQEFSDEAPQQPSALSTWLDSVSGDWQPNTPQQSAGFGLQADLFMAFTEKDGSFDEYNRLRLRSLVFNAQHDLNFGVLFGSLAIGDYDDFDEIVIPQLGVMLTDIGLGMDGTTNLRIGRYFADAGAYNAYLPADFAAPGLDGTRRSFLGGNLSVTGLELHNNRYVSSGHLHVSAGIASERQSLDFDNFDISTITGSNDAERFSADNWLATGRVSMQFDLDASSVMRVGATAIISPAEVVFTDVGLAEPERAEIKHNNFAVEFGALFNTSATRSHEWSMEVWLDDSQYRDTSGAYPSARGRGEWGMYQMRCDEEWSLGALVARHEVLGLLDGEDHAHDHSAWLSYIPGFGSAVTMFGTHTNPGDQLEKYYTFGIEYSINIGRAQTHKLNRWF
ncbi:MAG: hypothetical protein ACI84O_000898 [Myxococcota bacterium]|jgi:hypothetical protein